ncbi:MAG: hypothetical protein ACP6IQ_05550 [Candidatus Njordarchaeia archaeon]
MHTEGKAFIITIILFISINASIWTTNILLFQTKTITFGVISAIATANIFAAIISFSFLFRINEKLKEEEEHPESIREFEKPSNKRFSGYFFGLYLGSIFAFFAIPWIFGFLFKFQFSLFNIITLEFLMFNIIVSALITFVYCYTLQKIGVSIGILFLPSAVGTSFFIRNLISYIAQIGSILIIPFLLKGEVQKNNFVLIYVILTVYYILPSALIVYQNAIASPNVLDNVFSTALLDKIRNAGEEKNRIIIIGSESEILIDLASRFYIAELTANIREIPVEPIYIPSMERLKRIDAFSANIVIVTAKKPRNLVLSSNFEFGKVGLVKVLIAPGVPLFLPIVITERIQDLASHELLMDYLNIPQARIVFLITTRREEMISEEMELFVLFRDLISTAQIHGVRVFMGTPRSYLFPSTILMEI